LLASIDPDDENSLYQDWSMQALQSRGVQFLSYHTALEEQARVLSGRDKLSQSPEDIVEDVLAHTQTGILVVAAKPLSSHFSKRKATIAIFLCTSNGVPSRFFSGRIALL
jgi:hypothetical protein